jgi:histidinol phosphatase-like enzyme (inositol monophosphatase family)
LLDETVTIVRAAGERTLRWFRAPGLGVDRKDDGTPVTAADRDAERFVRTELASRHPNDAVVGEEEDDTAGTSGRRWIIDPIDGTKAFTHGIPTYSNLLAAEDEHGLLLGVVNLPALGETVYAGRGIGCFCNGAPARVSDRTELSGAYLTATGIDDWPPGAVDAALAARVTIRTWGDGYGYALVATGRVEAMVDASVSIWDIAPMPVVIGEAGGRFTDLDGVDRIDGGHGLATNGHLHDAMRGLFR